MKIRNEINISCLVKHYFERCKIEFRIKCTKILHQHIPCGLVARIRRFHRRGRGSIPRKGAQCFFAITGGAVVYRLIHDDAYICRILVH